MKQLLAIVSLLIFSNGIAQNLVPNPSFEDYTKLPDNKRQLGSHCKHWNQVDESAPHYLHTQGTDLGKVPPEMQPHTGNACVLVGDIIYSANNTTTHNWGGAMKVKLKEPLKKGAVYKISYWVSAGPDAMYERGYKLAGNSASNGLGAFFYKKNTNFTWGPRIVWRGIVPQVVQQQTFWSEEWTEVSFEFQADSAYKYMMVGVLYGIPQVRLERHRSRTNEPRPPECFYFIDDVSVEPIKPAIVGDTATCYGDTIQLKANPGYAFKWSSSANPDNSVIASALNVSPTTTTTYYLYSSYDTISHTVYVTNPRELIKLPKDTVLCLHDSVKLSVKRFKGASFRWRPINDTAASIYTKDTGLFYLDINYKGCSARSDSIRVFRPQDKINLHKELYLCKNESLILRNRTNAKGSYKWSPNGETSNTISVSKAGTYSLALSISGCPAYDTTVVIDAPPIYLQLGDSHVICERDSQRLKLDAGKGHSQYRWYPNGDTTHFILVSREGQYFVVVKDFYGCSADDSSRVRARCPKPISIFFPNAFSPNGDGLNDYFSIKGQEVAEYHLQIFNRWGTCVFESDQLDEQWDGTFEDMICENGIYFWHCSYMGPDKKGVMRRKLAMGRVSIVR